MGIVSPISILTFTSAGHCGCHGGERPAGKVRDYGRIANMPAALDRLACKLGRDGVRLRFCYEAGPCGYGIHRHLVARGHECIVVAPSLIPKRPGDP